MIVTNLSAVFSLFRGCNPAFPKEMGEPVAENKTSPGFTSRASFLLLPTNWKTGGGVFGTGGCVSPTSF